jgi:hypothetical protein
MNRIFAWLLALSLLAGPAAAAEVKAPPKYDPAKAYVVVEIVKPEKGDMAGAVTLARYDAEGGDVRGGLRSPGSKLPKGVIVRTGIGGKPVVKGAGSRLHVFALEPDTWVIEGVGNTAFSLGSSRFTLTAGDVLDLGVLSPKTDWPEGQGPGISAGQIAKIALLGPFAKMPKAQPAMLEMRPRGSSDLAIPEPFRARATAAAYTPGAKFGNYLGGLVNRLDGRKGRPGD